MAPLKPQAILEIFADLVAELTDRLSELDDWGHSGGRSDQYRHDVVADDVLVGGLRRAGFRVLSEESGLTGDGDLVVVVDPIDGSTNASRGLPWYATSLCAVDGDGPLAADVANLATGERFRAVRGEGAAVDHLGLRPSGCRRLSDAIVAFSGLPPEHGGWSQFRAYGAAALDLCAVAAGRFDGFVDIDGAHGVWDYLGAVLVCHEAGVAVGEGRGRDLVTLDPSARRAPMAAATPELLAELQAMQRRWRTGDEAPV
ncbi:MAG: inositol monophosphatase family protein [Acidimicrobiales bacterium]